MNDNVKTFSAQPGSYSHRILADGATRFAFRKGIRLLLGMSDGNACSFERPPSSAFISDAFPKKSPRNILIRDPDRDLRTVEAYPAENSQKQSSVDFHEKRTGHEPAIIESREDFRIGNYKTALSIDESIPEKQTLQSNPIDNGCSEENHTLLSHAAGNASTSKYRTLIDRVHNSVCHHQTAQTDNKAEHIRPANTSSFTNYSELTDRDDLQFANATVIENTKSARLKKSDAVEIPGSTAEKIVFDMRPFASEVMNGRSEAADYHEHPACKSAQKGVSCEVSSFDRINSEPANSVGPTYSVISKAEGNADNTGASFKNNSNKNLFQSEKLNSPPEDKSSAPILAEKQDSGSTALLSNHHPSHMIERLQEISHSHPASKSAHENSFNISNPVVEGKQDTNSTYATSNNQQSHRTERLQKISLFSGTDKNVDFENPTDESGRAQTIQLQQPQRITTVRSAPLRSAGRAAFWERSYMGRLYLRPLR